MDAGVVEANGTARAGTAARIGVEANIYPPPAWAVIGAAHQVRHARGLADVVVAVVITGHVIQGAGDPLPDGLDHPEAAGFQLRFKPGNSGRSTRRGAHAVAETNGVGNHVEALLSPRHIIADVHTTVGALGEVIGPQPNPAATHRAVVHPHIRHPAAVINSVKLVRPVTALQHPGINRIIPCRGQIRAVRRPCRGFRGIDRRVSVRHCIAALAVINAVGRVEPSAAKRHLPARGQVGVHVVEHHLVGLVAHRAERNHRGARLPSGLHKIVELVNVAHVLIHRVLQRPLRHPCRQRFIRAETVAGAGEHHHAGEWPRRLLGGHLRQAGLIGRGHRQIATAGFAAAPLVAWFAALLPGHGPLGQDGAIEAHGHKLIRRVAHATQIVGSPRGFRAPSQAVSGGPNHAVFACRAERAGAVGHAIQVHRVGGERPC